MNANWDLQFYLFRLDSVQQNMCLAASLQHRPLASMDIQGIPWHSMTFHDPQVNVEGLRLLQSYSRGVCNCLWSSAATNLTSPGFWSMALVAVPVACWILSNFQICWLILSWFYLWFQHFQHDICFVSCISCVMTGVEHLDIFDLGIAWKGYPKAAASWRWQDIPIRSRNTKKPHKIIQFHMGCMMLFVWNGVPWRTNWGIWGSVQAQTPLRKFSMTCPSVDSILLISLLPSSQWVCWRYPMTPGKQRRRTCVCSEPVLDGCPPAAKKPGS